MSEPFASRRRANRKSPKWAYELISITFLFILPLPFLFVLDYFRNPRVWFDLGFFISGTLLELALAIGVLVLFNRGTLNRRQKEYWKWLNHTIVGLPFTVYLAAAQPLALLVVIRLAAVWWQIFAMRRQGLLIGHSLLFLSGLALYLFFQNYGLPTPTEIINFSIFGLLVAGLFGLRALILQFDLSQRKQLQQTRREKRLRHQISQKQRDILQWYLSPSELQDWNNEVELQNWNSPALLVGIDITEVFAVLGSAGTISIDSIKLQQIQHEWDMQMAKLYTICQSFSLQISTHPAPILFLLSQQRDLASQPTEAINETLNQLVGDLLEWQSFVQRSRQAQERRGMPAWNCPVLLTRAKIRGLRWAHNNPLPLFSSPDLEILDQSHYIEYKHAPGIHIHKKMVTELPDAYHSDPNKHNPSWLLVRPALEN